MMSRVSLVAGAAVVMSLLAVPVQAQQSACAGRAPFDSSKGDAWSGWGGGLANTRRAQRTHGTLSAADLPGLKLVWAFGFPGAHAVIGQPTVAGNRVFVGVDTGDVYAIDTASGCQDWTFKADAGVRTAPVLGRAGGTWTVFVGDLRGQVYAVDATSGTLRWKVKADDHPTARITGTPQFLPAGTGASARLFVPVSSGEEGAGARAGYACCTFRGSVVALDAATGKPIWKTYAIERAAAATGPNRFGPSGAAIWSAPTIDAARGLLYVGTGDAYSAPADPATDAIVAMDLATGAVRWKHQATVGDVWTVQCLGKAAPADCGPDQDFGSPPMLVAAGGRNLLVAGQKSGNVWAFDPRTGDMIWRTPLVPDTTKFGAKIVWGGAADDRRAYFGLGTGGVAAVRLADGATQWFTELAPKAGRESHPGEDGAVTVADGVVFSGGWDGVVRALSADTGKVLWEFDTARDLATVNGVAAHGGSMAAAGSVVAGKALFVPSGYIGVKNGMPGNVLLMFSPSR